MTTFDDQTQNADISQTELNIQRFEMQKDEISESRVNTDSLASRHLP